MDDTLPQALESLPPEQPRSKLEPYRAHILRWRREGRSYERIKAILATKCGIHVSVSNLFGFVQRSSRPRKSETEPQPAAAIQPPQPTSDETVLPVRPLKPRMSIEERRAQADAIRAQFAHSALPEKPKDTRPRFEYDPDKPLTLLKTKEK